MNFIMKLKRADEIIENIISILESGGVTTESVTDDAAEEITNLEFDELMTQAYMNQIEDKVTEFEEAEEYNYRVMGKRP